jgi:hypothetical protein
MTQELMVGTIQKVAQTQAAPAPQFDPHPQYQIHRTDDQAQLEHIQGLLAERSVQ